MASNNGLQKFAKTLYGLSLAFCGYSVYSLNVSLEVSAVISNLLISVLVGLQGFIISKLYEHSERIARMEERVKVLEREEKR